MKSNDEAARIGADADVIDAGQADEPQARHRRAAAKPAAKQAKPRRGAASRAARNLRARAAARLPATHHSRSSRRWSTRCRATKAGCTSSSTTACACCAAATAMMCAASRAMASTGRTRCGPIVEALAKLELSGAWVDGELIVTDPNGRSDFSLLQHILEQGRLEELQFCAFDLLYWNGEDLRDLPLAQRKAKLDAAFAKLPAKGPLRLADQIHSDSCAADRPRLQSAPRGPDRQEDRFHLRRAAAPRTGSRSSVTANRSSSWAAPPIYRAAARARSRRCWSACAPARAAAVRRPCRRRILGRRARRVARARAEARAQRQSLRSTTRQALRRDLALDETRAGHPGGVCRLDAWRHPAPAALPRPAAGPRPQDRGARGTGAY